MYIVLKYKRIVKPARAHSAVRLAVSCVCRLSPAERTAQNYATTLNFNNNGALHMLDLVAVQLRNDYVARMIPRYLKERTGFQRT